MSDEAKTEPSIAESHFSALDQAAKTAAANIAEALRAAIDERGAAVMVTTGGPALIPVFDVLRQADIDWSKVTVSLTDERYVPPEHVDSNEGLVRQHLLVDAAADAHFIRLLPDEDPESPNAALPHMEEVVRKLPKPFDAVLLTTGPDGHVASLFPHNAALRAGGLAVAAKADFHAHWRLTMTGQALCATKGIHLVVAGERPKLAYAKAQAGGDVKETPLRIVLDQTRAPVTVYIADSD